MIIVGTIVASIALIIGIVWFIVSQNKHYNQISFKETLELTNLPIITFHHINKDNDIKLNFLLDTGANRSILTSSMLDKCEYVKVGKENSLCGLDGIDRMVTNAGIVLQYSEKPYKEVFQISDMSSVFDKMKAETGVTIHGILGNSFFNKYKYVIDFDKLVVYSKGFRR